MEAITTAATEARNVTAEQAYAQSDKDKSSQAYERLLIEKGELDEKIVKLNAFIANSQKAQDNIGYLQLEQMRRQLDVMTDYSNILNTRILRWDK